MFWVCTDKYMEHGKWLTNSIKQRHMIQKDSRLIYLPWPSNACNLSLPALVAGWGRLFRRGWHVMAAITWPGVGKAPIMCRHSACAPGEATSSLDSIPRLMWGYREAPRASSRLGRFDPWETTAANCRWPCHGVSSTVRNSSNSGELSCESVKVNWPRGRMTAPTAPVDSDRTVVEEIRLR
jgi:hypothetical protein